MNLIHFLWQGLACIGLILAILIVLSMVVELIKIIIKQIKW